MTVTVGIPTLDRYPYVEALLDDLARQTRLPDEVLIVDQTAAHRRRALPTARWSHAFPVRVLIQDVRGTTKARNRLLKACASDIILQVDDDSRVDPDYVESHLRHYADERVDVVCGPVYEWDADTGDWYVKWKNHLMIGGWDGPPFVSAHFFSGGNSSIRVRSALAVGGWDENILTHGEDEDFSDRLHTAGALVLCDPAARLLHLRAPTGGERATEWGRGPDANWRVLAGYLYYYLTNRPAYEAWRIMVGYLLRPLWHVKHRRVAVGMRLMPRVLWAIPVSVWRWIRGRRLIDPSSPDRVVRRISKKEVSGWTGTLAAGSPRTVLPRRDPPTLPQ